MAARGLGKGPSGADENRADGLDEAPNTIPPTAMNEPTASVDSPDSPWPTVHPSASTPPAPIIMPPAM
jgi:hypothetical protein